VTGKKQTGIGLGKIKRGSREKETLGQEPRTNANINGHKYYIKKKKRILEVNTEGLLGGFQRERAKKPTTKHAEGTLVRREGLSTRKTDREGK